MLPVHFLKYDHMPVDHSLLSLYDHLLLRYSYLTGWQDILMSFVIYGNKAQLELGQRFQILIILFSW